MAKDRSSGATTTCVACARMAAIRRACWSRTSNRVVTAASGTLGSSSATGIRNGMSPSAASPASSVPRPTTA